MCTLFYMGADICVDNNVNAIEREVAKIVNEHAIDVIYCGREPAAFAAISWEFDYIVVKAYDAGATTPRVRDEYRGQNYIENAIRHFALLALDLLPGA